MLPIGAATHLMPSMTRPSNSAGRILIADDQEDILSALALLLKTEGYQTTKVRSPREAVTEVKRADFDAVLIDLNYTRDTTSGEEGLDLLGQLKSLDPTLSVIVMTAWSSVDLAVDAMRRGACDFMQKPWDDSRMLATLKTQVELSRALRKGRRLEAENHVLRQTDMPDLIAESPAMRPVVDVINQVAGSDANVLITGESGTGKNVIARTVHNHSLRKESSFVSVNTGGLTDTLFESDLFGHVKGAFTDARADRIGRFEMADGGTLFLDEIANVPLKQQAKLLHVVEAGEFEPLGSSKTRKTNVRIISATNADIHADVRDGNFRQDLLYRLNTVEIHLPALRERREDIPLLAARFVGEFATRYRKDVGGVDPQAVEMLRQAPWPGNVRELRHTIERAVLMAHDEVIRPPDLSLAPAANDSLRLDEMSLEDVERWLIRKALERNGGNANKAAETLGLSRSAFYRRTAKYGL